jgi:hypothetical protein
MAPGIVPGAIFIFEEMPAMKVQDFAYLVAHRTIEILEKTQHYKIPDELKKEVMGTIQKELDDLIKKASK